VVVDDYGFVPEVGPHDRGEWRVALVKDGAIVKECPTVQRLPATAVGVAIIDLLAGWPGIVLFKESGYEAHDIIHLGDG